MATASLLWGTNGIGTRKNGQGAAARRTARQLANVFDPRWRQVPNAASAYSTRRGDMRPVFSYLARIRIAKSGGLAQGEAVLLKIRPYIRSINSSEYIAALANGDLCVAVGYNGDVLQARDRAQDANKGIEIKYSIPKKARFSGSI